MPGKVYLVGAGPGDPELLTRKAWRVLQSADVVLHDDLVSDEILRTLPATALVLNVGKRCGAKGISQREINQRMVNLAGAGKSSRGSKAAIRCSSAAREKRWKRCAKRASSLK